MPLFILLTKLTGAYKEKLREQPEILEEICNKLETCSQSGLPQYATLGEYTFVNIIELENEKTVYGLALELNSVKGVETIVLPAISLQEYKMEVEKIKKFRF